MAAIAKGGERMVALNLALRCAARIASEIEAFEPVVAFLGNRPGISKIHLDHYKRYVGERANKRLPTDRCQQPHSTLELGVPCFAASSAIPVATTKKNN